MSSTVHIISEVIFLFKQINIWKYSIITKVILLSLLNESMSYNYQLLSLLLISYFLFLCFSFLLYVHARNHVFSMKIIIHSSFEWHAFPFISFFLSHIHGHTHNHTHNYTHNYRYYTDTKFTRANNVFLLLLV